jgi:hypothetical protein
MPGDYSRHTFDPRKHYVDVLMQQGRVQLDADWNEQNRIQQHRNETETRDVIGCCGAPLHGGGFALSALDGGRDLGISRGRIYVGGILCELDPSPVPASVIAGSPAQVRLHSRKLDGHPLQPGHWVELSVYPALSASPPDPGLSRRISAVDEDAEGALITLEGDLSALQSSPPINLQLRRIATFLTQPDFPDPIIDGASASPPPAITSIAGDLDLPTGRYLAYLDVWQREVTALDDPRLREVALGGPDTAARLKTMAQVRLLEVAATSPHDPSCATDFPEWQALTSPGSGRMNARTRAPAPDDDPCELPPTAGYRRLENQLYRIEIHDGGDRGTATFKWSRDHGSIETLIVEIETDGKRVKVSSTGKDELLGFQPGQWVEVLDDEAELKGIPHPLVQIDDVETGKNLIILNTDLSAHRGTARKLRRWDQINLVNAAGIVPLASGDAEGWVDLEDGVQVQFSEGSYRSGDFWLVPARTNTGEIEWPPFELPNAHPIPQPPAGIRHHYCRLALVHVDDPSSPSQIQIQDCRCRFPSLNENQGLFYVSGDGQEAMPAPPFAASTLAALPQPLVVGVLNLHCPPYPAKVRFSITKGTGELRSSDGTVTGTEIELPADSGGLVECHWDLGADLSIGGSPSPRDQNLPSQQVEAWLLDEQDHPIHLPIRFNANLSIAEQVAYDPGSCAGLNGQNTVQTAIDRLAEQLSLYKVSGDGQILFLGQSLQPIRVRAANRCGPVPLRSGWVTFTPRPGHGTVTPVTISGGIASCIWTLGPGQGVQELEAALQAAAGPVAEPFRLIFTASRSVVGAEAGIPVIEVITPVNGQPLRNDHFLDVPRLQGGISVICDAPLSPESGGGVPLNPPSAFAPDTVPSKPTCVVTLDIPYPLGSDREFWDFGEIAGFQPLILGSTVEIIENMIEWRPTDPTRRWLQILFNRLQSAEVTDRILGHLTVKGNFIWRRTDALPDLYVDGELFGRPDQQGRVAVGFPSGDQRRGGDLEMWFWLVPQQGLVVTVLPPVITVNVGGTARFRAEVSGAGPFRFQWRRNGENIAGANQSQLAIANVQPNHVGDYDVVVGNESETVTSQSARLLILFNPIDFPNVTLGDVSGVGPVLRARLEERGINHPALMVSMDPDELASVLEVSPARARTLIQNARTALGV